MRTPGLQHPAACTPTARGRRLPRSWGKGVSAHLPARQGLAKRGRVFLHLPARSVALRAQLRDLASARMQLCLLCLHHVLRMTQTHGQQGNASRGRAHGTGRHVVSARVKERAARLHARLVIRSRSAPPPPGSSHLQLLELLEVSAQLSLARIRLGIAHGHRELGLRIAVLGLRFVDRAQVDHLGHLLAQRRLLPPLGRLELSEGAGRFLGLRAVASHARLREARRGQEGRHATA